MLEKKGFFFFFLFFVLIFFSGDYFIIDGTLGKGEVLKVATDYLLGESVINYPDLLKENLKDKDISDLQISSAADSKQHDPDTLLITR